MLYSSFRPLYLYTFASVRVTRTSKATRTTTIRTVANSLPENEAILLTFLISKRYIPHTDLRKFFRYSGTHIAHTHAAAASSGTGRSPHNAPSTTGKRRPHTHASATRSQRPGRQPETCGRKRSPET